MEHWEFLIQKQGDRSWLPLASPNVQILEGRYRLVVRSNRANTDVEVRLTHYALDEVPPKRRVQKRSRRTNPEGLMVVIPFTYLKPGIWELQCSGDLLSDFLGQNWHYALQLHVLAQEVPTPHSPTPPLPTPQPQVDFVLTGSQTAEQVLQSLIETIVPGSKFNLQEEVLTQEFAPISPDSKTSQTSLEFKPQTPKSVTESVPTETELNLADGSATAQQQPLQIVLAKATYIGRRGEPIAISGEIEMAGGEVAVQPIRGGELRICLHDPQQYSYHKPESQVVAPVGRGTRTQIVAEIRQPLPASIVPPFPFSCTIHIPHDCPTQLILGQVSFYGILASRETSGVIELAILATQPFTITADVQDLLGVLTAPSKEPALPQQSQASPAPTPQEKAVSAPASLNLALFNLTKTPQRCQPLRLRPVSHQPIPAQIYRPQPEQGTTERLPELPKIPQRFPIKNIESVSEETSQLVAETVSASQTSLEAPVDSNLTATDEQTIEDLNQELDDDNTPPEMNDSNLEGIEDDFDDFNHLSPVDVAFQSLNLKERFWERLNALAADAEFLEELKLEESDELDFPTAEEAPEEVEAMDENFTWDGGGEEGSIPFLQKDNLVEQASSLPLHDSRLEACSTEDIFTKLGCSQEEPMDENFTWDGGEEEPFTPCSEELEAEYDTSPSDVEQTKEETVSDELTQPYIYAWTNSDWLAQEIVIDDERVVELPVESPRRDIYYPTSPQISLPLSETEPLPVPELDLPKGELIAGQIIKIRIRVPQPNQGNWGEEFTTPLVVKLWVEDCQTRSLLDEPYWITDLLPNGLGHLEAATLLTVPQGCLEIRTNAIAVDTSTQQESHKTTIERTVIPPDLGALRLDELFSP